MSADTDIGTVRDAVTLAFDEPSEAHTALDRLAARLAEADARIAFLVAEAHGWQPKLEAAEARVRELEAAVRSAGGNER